MSGHFLDRANSSVLSRVPRASTLEILLVLGLPTALWLSSSFFWQARSAGQVVFSDPRLLGTLVLEAIASILLLPYLRGRGWTPGAVAQAPDPVDILRGGVVWLGAMAAYYLVYMLSAVALTWSDSPQIPMAGSVSVWVGVSVAIINPLFEEFLWLGYLVPALQSRVGLRAACIASVALRVAVHAYQGPMALISIAPIGAVLTWYYVRTGRLWPVIVAHMIADAVGLGALSRQS